MRGEAKGIENKGENKKSTDADGHLWTSNGGDEGDRTPDLCIANAALSLLSYTPTDQIFQPQAYACGGGIMPEADIESKSLRRLERRFKAPFLDVRQLLFQQIP